MFYIIILYFILYILFYIFYIYFLYLFITIFIEFVLTTNCLKSNKAITIQTDVLPNTFNRHLIAIKQ